MRKLGFTFSEIMTGTYTLTGKPDEQREIRLSLRIVADDALRHVRDKLARVEGTLDMEEFADDVPVTGTIEIAPFSRRLIRYDLLFVGNDGEPYRLAGQKDVKLSDLLTTMTNLTASITDGAGVEMARCRVRFDMRADLVPFIASWKPALA